MKAGELVLIPFPQADLSPGKLRPALVIAESPGNHDDFLLALVTSRLYQAVPDFDEIITTDDPDYGTSRLKRPSVVRLGRLATVERTTIVARLGRISPQRLARIQQTLSSWLLAASPS